MLDLMRRGTVEIASVTWEYHGDSNSTNDFYITPQPGWVLVGGLPAVQIVQYETSDDLNGTGYAVVQVQLTIPDSVVAAVTADIAKRFGVASPQFLMLPVQSGTIVNLTLPDGSGGTTGMQVSGTDFGSDAAIFQVPLTAAQMNTVKQAMGQQGSGPFEIQYSIIAPAQMPAVTAKLDFDSEVAFQYQVTSHEHTHWASSSTYTYDIHEQLSQSDASKVVVDKVDPNLPQSVVDAVATWGEQVIEDLVSKEVAAALALEQGASGTQSFSVSQISSFTESYQQNETILWRLQPLATLPTFGDLGLTTAQIASLETTVDKRQFVAQVTPQCLFETPSHLTAFSEQIHENNDPFMSNIKPLTRLDVTISYPTLTSSSTRTHTFTSNAPFTWQGDWDDTAGGVYSLDYTATYQDGTQVSGVLDQIDATNYTLSLAAIGTLNVIFDASQFFTAEKDVVQEVTVDFAFAIPQQEPYLQTAVLNAQNQQHVFSSVFPAPATTDYVYTVTYTFAADVSSNPYTSDAKTQNGQWVRLLSPDAMQWFTVLATVNDGQNEILEADINIYYDGQPYYPDIPASSALPRPTQASPIQLTFPIQKQIELAASKTKIQIQKRMLFANTAVTPLTVVATIVLDDGTQLQIGPFNFTPTSTALLTVDPIKQYAFLGIDPEIVDWEGGALNSIKMNLKAVRYTPPATGDTVPSPVTISKQWPTLAISRQPDGRAYPIYYPVLNLPNGYTDLEFDWVATYVYKSGSVDATGTEKGTLLSLPVKATSSTQPASVSQ